MSSSGPVKEAVDLVNSMLNARSGSIPDSIMCVR
jgi:hypothetical protein